MEPMFGTADSPWLPTLVEVLRLKDQDPSDPDLQVGWDALYVPDTCPLVQARMAVLKERFDERYAFRMLSAETTLRWQVRLQNRFDSVLERYERAYRIVTERTDLDSIGELTVVKTSGTDTNGGQDTRSSSNSSSSSSQDRLTDTPDTTINDSDSYASSTSKGSSSSSSTGEGTTKYGRTFATDRTTSTERLYDVSKGVMSSIRGWTDVDTLFVGEFENLFLNIFWM